MGVLETRKEGLGGNWFTTPGESSGDAFMRRLKKADPAYEIYEAYVAEHTDRWAGAKALSLEEASSRCQRSSASTCLSVRSMTTSSTALARSSLQPLSSSRKRSLSCRTLVSFSPC